jgi:hypothetical protein
MALAALIVSIVAALAAVLGIWLARRSAAAAERSADEARKARLEQSSPQVAVTLKGVRTRWVLDDQFPRAVPVERLPGQSFIVPANNGVHIYVGAALTVRNEGPTTVWLHSTGWPQFDVQLDRQTGDPISPGDDDRERQFQDGVYQLQRDQETTVVLRDGPTLADLIAAGGHGDADVVLTATDLHGHVADTWAVHIPGLSITSIPGNQGEWKMGAWTQTTPTITTTTHTYHG